MLAWNLWPTCCNLVGSWAYRKAWLCLAESVFPTSSRVIVMLWVYGPHSCRGSNEVVLQFQSRTFTDTKLPCQSDGLHLSPYWGWPRWPRMPGASASDCPYPHWLSGHCSFSQYHSYSWSVTMACPSPCQAAGGTWCLAVLVHSEPPRLRQTHLLLGCVSSISLTFSSNNVS